MALPGSTASLPPPVQLPDFEGPLDLLLDEVRRQNVTIENIAVAPIMARFLEYVGAAAERNLNLDIEWLHMAATLIHWKSRSLLPRDVTEAPQQDRIRRRWLTSWPAGARSRRHGFHGPRPRMEIPSQPRTNPRRQDL